MKTNAMRILDAKGITYQVHTYTETNIIKGKDVALYLNENSQQVFKTLVTQGKSGQYFVFVVPVNKELNLKKAALIVSEKSLNLIPQKELLGLTGYLHGGCSPIGMKKQFPTFFDQSCLNYSTIYLSGGKIGYQLEIDATIVIEKFKYQAADLV